MEGSEWNQIAHAFERARKLLKEIASADLVVALGHNEDRRLLDRVSEFLDETDHLI